MNDAAAGQSRFLTLADTGEILALTAAETFELIRSGELPAIKVGPSWRVERVVLESYIDAKYEETRRMSLWQQSDFASLAELTIPRR